MPWLPAGTRQAAAVCGAALLLVSCATPGPGLSAPQDRATAALGQFVVAEFPAVQADNTPTWQIAAVYSDPALPAALPVEMQGAAVIVFGTAGVSGNTGCADFQAQARYLRPAAPATTDAAITDTAATDTNAPAPLITQADTALPAPEQWEAVSPAAAELVVLSDLRVGPVDPEFCTGRNLSVHEQILEVLASPAPRLSSRGDAQVLRTGWGVVQGEPDPILVLEWPRLQLVPGVSVG